MIGKGVRTEMKKTANSRKRPDGDKRMAVLRLELDYELATLYEAMMENDEEKKKECKRRLEKLRQELMRLQV
ncbi:MULTISPECIES: hypothetical protein [Geobacillus]|jgi:hypothetical protein|nr:MULTISPECIES: hypothetical protein [Geobacillus]ARP42066.1 hypothetical protein GTHT12_00504 [Geobacillus thermodenitrificans]KQB94070.1 hypothetical protein GEPA3_0997 [Geobacillus sp. PA-3]MEC5188431.1 hypothetical protein [Geobacillus thermodenitrificans]MED3718313.1 hypothetical protein [Geobacillus thermodenitrificans]MED3905041.1 hypothetical protein [Geobacillus thermodenitrificans]